MKQSVSVYDFEQAFDDYDRSNNFSVEGRRALFEFLEEVMGEDWELDVIGICCDFSEYGSAMDAITDGDPRLWSDEEAAQDEDESDEDYGERREEAALEWLRDQTQVIEFDGGVIIQCF